MLTLRYGTLSLHSDNVFMAPMSFDRVACIIRHGGAPAVVANVYVRDWGRFMPEERDGLTVDTSFLVSRVNATEWILESCALPSLPRSQYLLWGMPEEIGNEWRKYQT